MDVRSRTCRGCSNGELMTVIMLLEMYHCLGFSAHLCIGHGQWMNNGSGSAGEQPAVDMHLIYSPSFFPVPCVSRLSCSPPIHPSGWRRKREKRRDRPLAPSSALLCFALLHYSGIFDHSGGKTYKSKREGRHSNTLFFLNSYSPYSPTQFHHFLSFPFFFVIIYRLSFLFHTPAPLPQYPYPHGYH